MSSRDRRAQQPVLAFRLECASTPPDRVRQERSSASLSFRVPLPPRLNAYDIVLDANSRWCVVRGAREEGALAHCPALEGRVLLAPPLEVLCDPSPFLRLQPTSRLVVALIAWHARDAAAKAERVVAELRAVLGGPGQPGE